MSHSGQLKLKVIGDPDFLAALRQYAENHPAELAVGEEQEEQIADRWGFDLITLAAVVTIVSGTLSSAALARQFYRWLMTSRGNRIILQTPRDSLELRRESGISEQDVENFLEAARRMQR